MGTPNTPTAKKEMDAAASKMSGSDVQKLKDNATGWQNSTSSSTKASLAADSQKIMDKYGIDDKNTTTWNWSDYTTSSGNQGSNRKRSSGSSARPDPTVTFSKYAYEMGLYEVGVSALQYTQSGIFVSKPYNVSGNVIEVELETFENHPVFDLTESTSDRETSIEYYVTFTDSPALEQWLPILPRDQKEVRNELLLFKTSATSRLRFKARQDQPIYVYENGKLIDETQWTIYPNGINIQINKTRFIQSNIYTIDYTPDTSLYNPWVVNFVESGLAPITIVEKFPKGTNRNGTLYLNNYPYIQKEVTGSQLLVTLSSANIAAPSSVSEPYSRVLPLPDGQEPTTDVPFTKNITNYSGDTPELKSYNITPMDKYLGFEYYHDGNKLQFTETFNNSNNIDNQEINHGDATIEVEYKVLAPVIRLKAIFRNTSQDALVTPTMNKTVLYFNIMR